MSKKNETKVTNVTKSVKKSTKGIPRITSKVFAMDADGKKAWFDSKCSALSPEIQAEIQARLAAGPIAKVGKKSVDFVALFAGKSLETLTLARAALDKAIEDTTLREESEINAKIAELMKQRDNMVEQAKELAAKRVIPAVVPVNADPVVA